MNLQALRAIPVDDRAWLLAGLSDALAGGTPVLPAAPDLPPDEVQRLQATALPEGTAVVVRTSGSTGVPKAVALSAESLRASAIATHEALGGPGQWLVTLPASLISGLQLLVRSEMTGIAPRFFDGVFDARAVLEAADTMEHERRYVSLVPVQLARLLDLAESDPAAADMLRSFAGVLVGGQGTPVALRQRAHDMGVALSRSYGMTETSGGCVYDGVEIGDTRVRIREGEVQLSGSALALGYVGDAEMTDRCFVTDTNSRGETRRWYRTGDAGEMLGGMLTITGRLDRVIVSGGVNVSLDQIEQVASELPGWHGSVAMPVASDEWGERPALVREAAGEDPHGTATFDDVRRLVRERLGAAAVPDVAHELPALPRLASGKPDLIEVQRLLTGLHH